LALNELSAEDVLVRQVLDDFRHVILLWTDDRFAMIYGLNGSLSEVVALPVQLTSCYFDQLVEVKAPWKNAKNIDQSFEIVQVRINAVCDSVVLNFQSHSLAVFKCCFMDLSYACCCKRVQVDLPEMLLPVASEGLL
jgi:hypothetical protein